MDNSSSLMFSNVNELAVETITFQFNHSDCLALLASAFGLIAYLTYGRLWSKQDEYLYQLYERPQEHYNVSSGQSGPKDIAQQMCDQNQDVVIFWGSQSGTAERLSHRLARDCTQRFGLNVAVGDLSDYDHESISKIPNTKFAIFIVSTYGEGDPSDNTGEFLDWLRKRSDKLLNLQYAAFGLGNSNYVYYNKVIDDIVRYLNALSAVSLLEVGRADDADSSTEEDFISWKDDLFVMFNKRLQLHEHDPIYEPSVELTTEIVSKVEQQYLAEPLPLKLSRKAARDYSAIKSLPVTSVKSLVSDPLTAKYCLHLELDIRNNPQIKYKTGDHLAVWPSNSEQEVQRILSVLGLLDQRDTEISIVTKDGSNRKCKLPARSTISALLRHHLEICGPVSRDTISALRHFAPSQIIQDFLQGLSSKTGYVEFAARSYLTFARLLEQALLHDPTANWSKLPLSFVIESLRPMSPRYYSISSSSMTSSRQLSITVAVSPTHLPSDSNVTIPGLATSFLAAMTETAVPKIYAHVRRSTFKMPFLHKTPIVLIAAGTGIAPFRAFLQERAQMAQISNQEIGQVLLVFGCRNTEDYLYETEIKAIREGPLKGKLEVITAFSRLDGQKKCYVQDRLSEQAVQLRVSRMLCEDEATLYLCGSTTMAKAAGKAIMAGVKMFNQCDEKKSKTWADGMKRSRRWQEDVWG